jgi:hypothetical protein
MGPHPEGGREPVATPNTNTCTGYTQPYTHQQETPTQHPHNYTYINRSSCTGVLYTHRFTLVHDHYLHTIRQVPIFMDTHCTTDLDPYFCVPLSPAPKEHMHVHIRAHVGRCHGDLKKEKFWGSHPPWGRAGWREETVDRHFGKPDCRLGPTCHLDSPGHQAYVDLSTAVLPPSAQAIHQKIPGQKREVRVST